MDVRSARDVAPVTVLVAILALTIALLAGSRAAQAAAAPCLAPRSCAATPCRQWRTWGRPASPGLGHWALAR